MKDKMQELTNMQKLHSEKFDSLKKKILEFSRESSKECQLQKTDYTGGLFGWGDHKVTGEEFNKNLEIIGQSFIDMNDRIQNTISEFNTVYNTFDSLDKEYIQRILVDLKTASKASDEAKKTAKGLEKEHKNLKNFSKTVYDKLEEKSNILKLNSDEIEMLKTENTNLTNNIKKFESKTKEIKTLKTQNKNLKNDIKKLQSSIEKIDSDISKNFFNSKLSKITVIFSLTISCISILLHFFKGFF